MKSLKHRIVDYMSTLRQESAKRCVIQQNCVKLKAIKVTVNDLRNNLSTNLWS